MRRLIFPLVLAQLVAVPASAAWAVIASTAVCAGGLGTTTYTTSAVNSTGTDFIAGVLSLYNQADTHATITDSQGGSNNGTPTRLTCQNLDVEGHTCIFYWKNPAHVGSSHTFSVAGDQTGAHGNTICITTFSGSNLTTPYDSPNQSGTTATEPSSGPATLNPGSITPSAANYLVIAALGTYSSGTTTGPSGYIGVTTLASGVIPTCGIAYQIQSGGPNATNPGWTVATPTSSQKWAVAAASFAAAGGGGVAVVPIPPFVIQ